MSYACDFKSFLQRVFWEQSDQEPSDQGPHCLPVCKIGLKFQEYSADDINRRHFQMQVFLALSGLISVSMFKHIVTFQQAHGVNTTSPQHRCNVMTLHRR